MDYPRALSQIDEIHQQIAKGEIYRGYRSVPIAASGGVGFAAAVAVPVWATTPAGFVRYWPAVAVVAGLVGLSEIAYNYFAREGSSGRRRTRLVLGQFLPAAITAGVFTAAFANVSLTLVALLPGVWAACFGLGTFASRPYLPRTGSIVALYYLVAGAWLLSSATLGAAPPPWQVGGTFGVGQLMAAAVLYWELERPEGVELEGHETQEDR